MKATNNTPKRKTLRYKVAGKMKKVLIPAYSSFSPSDLTSATQVDYPAKDTVVNEQTTKGKKYRVTKPQFTIS